MAIKAKPKRRAQSNHSRGAFPRRLTWREIESAFNHLFDQGVETTEATRLIHRFRRARSQLLPIFSNMVVSPYERERTLANALLMRIGGRTTLTMVESVLADIDIYDPFKFELRRLAEKLAAEAAHLPDDDDEDEGDGEGSAESGDGEEGGGGRGSRQRARRGRAGAARGKRGGSERGESGEGERGESAAAGAPRPKPSRRRKLKPISEGEAKQLFTKPGEAFLASLDDPIDRLVAGFWLIEQGKRVSFVDRLAKVDDVRLVPFLTALLASDQRALVQSALKALAALGHPSAIESLDALIARTQTKAIRQRAEEVRAKLLEAAPAAAPAETDEAAPAEGRRRSRRSRPRPKNADLLPAGDDEPAVEVDDEPVVPTTPPDAAALGLEYHISPTIELVNETPIEAAARLPRLQNCLASGLASDGTQWIWVYRAGAGGTLERLTLCVDDSGWRLAVLEQGLPGDADRADLAAAAEAGEPRIEVTMAYGRRRVQQAAAINADRQLALPPSASAAMAWLGSGRRVEVEDETAGETLASVDSTQAQALLDHPLMAVWRVRMTPDGEATAQWLATRRRRSASRQRKLLIDDLVNAWLDEVGAATLSERLRLQAWLLRRANQDELADIATALAAQLLGDNPTANVLLREIVYRALGVALDEARVLRHAERAERAERRAEEAEAEAAEATDPVLGDDPDPDEDRDEADEAEPQSERPARDQRDGRRRDRRRRGGRNRRRGPGRAVAGKRLVATRCRRRRLAAQRVRQATARRLAVSPALRARKNRAHRRRR